jgi:hypothetical protein
MAEQAGSGAAQTAQQVPSIADNSAQSNSNSNASGSQADIKAVEAKIDANPNLSATQKVQAKKTLKSLKIKYNGKEYDEALPFEIPDTPESIDYMRKQLQMSRMGQTKSQELAEFQKQAVEFIDQLKKNPRKILSDPNIGVDLKRIASEILQEEIENAKKSPEQLEKEKLQMELKQLHEDRKREQEENKQRDFQRIQEQEYERYESQINSALESSDLPKTPYTVKKMADYMLLGLQNGMDVSPQEVLSLVREEMQNDLQEMFNVMPEEVIEKIVGKQTIDRLRKKNLQKAKQATAITKQQIRDVGAKKSEAPKEGTKDKKQGMKDFFGF